MKRLIALSLAFVLTPVVTAQQKIGTANMARLVSEYHKTKEMQDEFKVYEKDILAQLEEKKKEIQTVQGEAEKFQKEAQVPTLGDVKRSELLGKVTARQKQVTAMNRDLRAWFNRRRAAMQEMAVMNLASVRKEVLEIVQEVGNEEGFDFIFDRSGASNAGVAVLVYTRDATDLTAVLLERVKARAEAAETAEANE